MHQIQAFGAKPNTEFVKSLGQGVVNERGLVKVNEYLEVPGHPGVFAVGDIIDWEEQKQAAKANTHVQVVSANVVSFLEGKPYKKKYKGSPEMILIPLGKVWPVFRKHKNMLLTHLAERRCWLRELPVGHPVGRLLVPYAEGQGPVRVYDSLTAGSLRVSWLDFRDWTTSLLPFRSFRISSCRLV